MDPSKLAQSGKVALVINKHIDTKQASKIWDNLIYDASQAFLYSQYRYIGIFVAIISVIIVVVLGAWAGAIFTAIYCIYYWMCYI